MTTRPPASAHHDFGLSWEPAAGGRPPSDKVILPWWPAAIPVGRHAVTGNAYSDTLATLGRMAALIRTGAHHPAVQSAVADAVAKLPHSADRRARTAAIFAWLKPRVRFVEDEHLVAAAARLAGLALAPDAELLIAPWELLSMSPAMGDCDDFTMAAGAMLRAAGVPVQLVIVAADPRRPSDFTHVYLYALLEDGRPLAVDVSHGPHVGWEAPRVFDRQVWPVFDFDRTTGLNGLGFTLPSAGVPTVESGGGWGGVLQSIAAAGATTGLQILGAQFAQPKPGTYMQTKEGTYYYGGANPAGANLPFPPATGAGSGTWVLLGAGALLLVLVMGRR